MTSYDGIRTIQPWLVTVRWFPLEATQHSALAKHAQAQTPLEHHRIRLVPWDKIETIGKKNTVSTIDNADPYLPSTDGSKTSHPRCQLIDHVFSYKFALCSSSPTETQKSAC